MNKWRISSFVLIGALVATGIWGAAQYQESRMATARLENEYQRAFYSLLDDVENLEFLTGKAQIAGVQQSLALWPQVAALAENAQRDLSVLPLDHQALTATAAYLNDLVSFAEGVGYKVARGKAPDQQELAQIGRFYQQTAAAYKSLNELQAQVAAGRVVFSREAPAESFLAVNEQLPVTQAVSAPVKGLENLPEISAGEAQELAEKILSAQGYAAADAMVGTAQTANIPVYQVSFADGALLSISKQGGKLINLWRPQQEQTPVIGVEEAQKRAQQFLKTLGYQEMMVTAQNLTENTVQLTLARREKQVLYYPDSVLVEVSLADGAITAFQSGDYWQNFGQRQLAAVTVSSDQARQALNPAFIAQENSLALVQGQGGQEMLCHEFRGKCGEDDYVIHVDAAEGFEENISRRVSGDSGFYTR